jgi:hypothetical protein
MPNSPANGDKKAVGKSILRGLASTQAYALVQVAGLVLGIDGETSGYILESADTKAKDGLHGVIMAFLGDILWSMMYEEGVVAVNRTVERGEGSKVSLYTRLWVLGSEMCGALEKWHSRTFRTQASDGLGISRKSSVLESLMRWLEWLLRNVVANFVYSGMVNVTSWYRYTASDGSNCSDRTACADSQIVIYFMWSKPARQPARL